MNTLSYNKLNIKDEDVSLFVTRVKAFIQDSLGRIWIATSNSGCQLPGGHVEQGEDVFEALIRELREETGIDVQKEDIKGPFFELKRYTKTDDKRYRMSNILYFYVKTDDMPDQKKTNFTEREKEYNFTLFQVEFDNIRAYIESFMTEKQTQINKIIAQEILDAYDELVKFLEEKNNG